MAFLERNIFTAPEWILPDYLAELLPTNRLAVMENLQQSAVTGLINKNVLVRMLRAEEHPGTVAYSLEDFFTDLNRSIFKDYGDTDIYRRSLQNIYVNSLCDLVKPKEENGNASPEAARYRRAEASIENNDVKSLVTAELQKIGKELKRAKGDDRTRAHYQFLYQKIEDL